MKTHYRNLAIAVLAGLGLVALIALLVSSQAPDPRPTPVFEARLHADPVPKQTHLPDLPPPVPVEDITVEDITELQVEEVVQPVIVPLHDGAIAEAAEGAQAVPPPPAPSPPPGATQGPTTWQIQFASVEDLAGLVEDTHVILVLEFPDGRRLRLPQRLLASTVTLPVSESTFQTWLSQGRVTELVPTRELRRTMAVHGADLRYLAVLDDSLRQRVAELANGAEGLTLTIARGPTIQRKRG